MIISTSRDSSVSAVTAVPATRPSRSTVTRSVISRTSSSSCETNSTLPPVAVISRISANRCSTSARGRNTVGSSRTSIPGPSCSSRTSSIARTIARSARSDGRSSPTIAVGEIRTP